MRSSWGSQSTGVFFQNVGCIFFIIFIIFQRAGRKEGSEIEKEDSEEEP